MIKRYAYYLRQILPLMSNSWLPALFLLTASCIYMIFAPLTDTLQTTLHIAFYALNFSSILLLAYYNRNQSLFFIIIITIAYMLINFLKYNHGIIYYLTPAYLNLVFLTGSGILFFYFLPNHHFRSIDTIKFLIIIFAGVSLGEILSNAQIKINFSPSTTFDCGLQFFGISFMWVIISIMILYTSIKNDILGTSTAFASISVVIGFYFSAQPSALSLFFTTAALIIFCGITRQIYTITRKDNATGLNNGRTFMLHAKKFPLKYGLGIICIDDYHHLLQAFRKNGIGDIMLMISKKITSLEPDALLYRCTPDEFVIIFPNAEKGSSYDRIDEIRRQIAASEFILPQVKRPLKITVSCCVADKKRSDSNVNDVFIRAHHILQKTYKFNQNITSRA